jgi:hypothetical protein
MTERRTNLLLSRWVPILVIVGAASWRVATITSVTWANFSPLMALAFCGGVYFRRGTMWLVPFLALAGSDLWIDRYYAAAYHYHFEASGIALRLLCFAAGLAIGGIVAARPRPINLLSGILGSSLLFYVATNTAAWKTDPFYAPTVGGWWQALTVGHPQFPPTIFFFRNTLVSDLLFTGAFALLVRSAAWAHRPAGSTAPSKSAS